MKWFKHDSDAINDPKVDRLIAKFGSTGYATYFLVLELIANSVEDIENVENWGILPKECDFDYIQRKLNHDNVGTISDIIGECKNLGLFEEKDGQIYCPKILKRLDEYKEKLYRNRHKVSVSPDSVGTKSPKVALEQNRIDKNRIEYKGGSKEHDPKETAKELAMLKGSMPIKDIG